MTAALSDAEKLAIFRRMTEIGAKAGIPFGDTNGPGQLATRHDPRGTAQRPHLEVIDQELTQLLATENGALMVFTPPQVGKSTRVSRWFPFWWLTQRPADSIILASYAANLAIGHSVACREMVRQYGQRYGLVLDRAEANRASWRTTAGGGIKSRGVRSGLTGFTMDLGIIDDPVKDREQAENEDLRNKVFDWYSSTWVSRRQPHTREVLVCTRWHQDDLAGRLLKEEGRVEEGGRWRVVHLPARALPEDHELGVYADPLGREPGQPLSHPKLDPDDVDALLEHWATQHAKSTVRDWNALYQGLPHDSEGTLLTRAQISAATGTPPTEFTRRVIAVDPAGGGKRDSVGIVELGLSDTGVVWILADYTANLSADNWSMEVARKAFAANAERVVVESNYGGDMATLVVRQAWAYLQAQGEIPATALCPLVTDVVARVSKVLRAEPIAQAIKLGRVRFAAGADLKTHTNEWQMWQPGSKWSPGSLDAGVHGATELLPAIQRGTQMTNPAKKSRADYAAPTPGTTAAKRRRVR